MNLIQPVFGAAAFVFGWTYLSAAVRLDLTIGDTGWGGAVAVIGIIIGAILVWQSIN